MYRHHNTMRLKAGVWAVLLALSACSVLWAAVGNQPYFTTADAPLFDGAMLRLRAETPGLLTFSTGGTTPVYTYFLTPAGRFQIQTSPVSPDGGNPTRTGDENRNIASVATAFTTTTWGYEYSSKVTIAVDPDPTGGTGGQPSGGFYDPHYLTVSNGVESTTAALPDYWPVIPEAGARDVGGTFRVPGTVTGTGTSAVVQDWITVRQTTTVIGDTVQFEYIITNTSATTHTIGMRLLIDSRFGGTSNYDGASVWLPNGDVITSEKRLPDTSDASSTLPDTWVSYDDASSPTMVLRGTVAGSEVTSAGQATMSAGKPDAIYFGQMRNMGVANQYYYTPNSAASFVNEDWAYAVWWDADALSPGASRRYVTYYGAGASAANYDPPYALMAFSPYSLKVKAGQDPNTATPTSYYLTDDEGNTPFKLHAYVDNFGTSTLVDASARLRLPTGLSLASTETDLSKSLGTIAHNVIKSTSWDVYASAVRPGRTSIRFTGPQGKVVTKTLNIPAIPILAPLDDPLNRGLEMVSIPYNFVDNDAEVVFHDLGALGVGNPASLVRWDPVTMGYKYFPDSYCTNLSPGLGYWLLNRNRTTVVLPNPQVVDESNTYQVSLKKGWNQIGCPFSVTMNLSQVKIVDGFGAEWTMANAVSRNLLVPTLFAYDLSTNTYTWESELNDATLEPYMGYWIYALDACTLVFPAPETLAPSSTPTIKLASTLGTDKSENWRVNLQVAVSGVSPQTVGLGVNTQSVTGLDRYDVLQPPASIKEQSVYLQSAVQSAQAASGLACLVDTRAPVRDPQEWNVVVRTNATNAPVTITWPSLDSLPSNLIATLVDKVTGSRVYMRTVSSYTFNTGSDATERALTVTIQPRSAQGLALMSVSAVANGQGGAALTYTLSADASVDITIRNIAGRAIAQISTGQVMAAGRNTALWNGQSRSGLRVPNGRYLFEITAHAPDTGQSVKAVQPLQIMR